MIWPGWEIIMPDPKTQWIVVHPEWIGGSLGEGLSFHDGSMGRAHLMAWTIIQEEPGWLKALLQGMRKMAGCPGKHREDVQESKKWTRRFGGYNQNAVNSDNTEDSSYGRGHPGGDGPLRRG